MNTRKQLGVFTTSKTLYPVECKQACITGKQKTGFMIPGVSITKTKGVIWGDKLGKDIYQYEGGSSVGVLGANIPDTPVNYAVEGFASTDPNTGKRNNNYLALGISSGFAVGIDPSIGNYFTWAKRTKLIFDKPWAQ